MYTIEGFISGSILSHSKYVHVPFCSLAQSTYLALPGTGLVVLEISGVMKFGFLTYIQGCSHQIWSDQVGSARAQECYTLGGPGGLGACSPKKNFEI